MLEFIKEHPILTSWAIFVVLVYLYALLDYIYYRYNIKQKLFKIYEALTEEE